MQLPPTIERKRLRKVEEVRVDRTDGAHGGLHPGDHIPAASARLAHGSRDPVPASMYDAKLVQRLGTTINRHLNEEATMAETSVNNGVNVEALLAAREALKSAPQAAKFTWRASCKWQDGTFSHTKVQG